MKNLELDHINLAVPNLQEAVKFYTEVLNFEIKEQYSKDGRTFMFLTDGTVVYELLENSTLSETVIDHIAYKSNDIKADFEHFNKQGIVTVPLSHIDFLFENGVDYFFIKGAGNDKIEFCQRSVL